MRKFLTKIFFLLLLLVISPVFSIACSPYEEPKSKFDPEMYVFIGEVVGYTDKFESKRLLQTAYGLKIKVLENVYLPKESKDYFEVFPFDISSDCKKYIGFSETELQEDYPLNSKVRVISGDSWLLPEKNKTGQLILEVHYPRWIYRNDLNNQTSTTAGSIFNYADKEYYYDVSLEFEILKDLKRLAESNSDEEKTKILERLIYLPKRSIDFEATVQNYIKNPEIKQTLIDKRKSLK